MNDSVLGEISVPKLISDCRLLCIFDEGSIGYLIKWTERQSANRCKNILLQVVLRPHEFAIAQKMKDESGSL